MSAREGGLIVSFTAVSPVSSRVPGTLCALHEHMSDGQMDGRWIRKSTRLVAGRTPNSCDCGSTPAAVKTPERFPATALGGWSWKEAGGCPCRLQACGRRGHRWSTPQFPNTSAGSAGPLRRHPAPSHWPLGTWNPTQTVLLGAWPRGAGRGSGGGGRGFSTCSNSDHPLPPFSAC